MKKYADFTVRIVSAMTTHATSGDPAAAPAPPVVTFPPVATSYVTCHQH
jgi:hypothetical protein